METIKPTTEEFDELIAFLRRFYFVGYQPVEVWKGGEKIEGNVDFMRWPIYEPGVLEFMEVLSKDCWVDDSFHLFEIGEQIKDEQFVLNEATLKQVKQMLTYCVQGEKFVSHGHMGRMIKDGHVARLLQRLREIKKDLIPTE